MSLPRSIRAQVEAEVKIRLRSPATVVAAVALFVVSLWWIPDPNGKAVSIAWKGPAGALTSGIYESAYVGASAAILAALFLTLIGFYLVAGSVKRDEETRVGAILAATPLPKSAYLTGKWVAHFVYLVTLGAVSAAAGMVAFFRFGTGSFAPLDFLSPFLLLVVPGLAMTAACALWFDVTPGLSGRGGQVAFFFFWSFVFLTLPVLLSGGFTGREPGQSMPLFDPTGLASFTQWMADTVPGGEVRDISIGLMIVDEPIERISWPGLRWSFEAVGARLASFFWVAVVMALAVAIFRRFDPSRRAGRSDKKLSARPSPLEPTDAAPSARATAPLTLPALAAPLAPGFGASALAEARLIWLLAGRWRWPLLLAAGAAAVPGPAPRIGVAAFLLLLLPVISEVAARERLAGAADLVFSQPGVPTGKVMWKAVATLLFVLTLGLPGLITTAFSNPRQALAYFGGLLFVALFATAAGTLTGGGKLFIGLGVALWYAAINGAPALDWSGLLAPGTTAGTPWIFSGIAIFLLASAVVKEKVQGRR